MRYTIHRYRGIQRQWFGITRAGKPNWYKSKASAYEYMSFASAMAMAQRWAEKGNNWRYEVHSTQVTEVR